MSDKTINVSDSKERVALELMIEIKNAMNSRGDSRVDDPFFIAQLYDAALEIVKDKALGIHKIEQLLKQ